MNLEKLAVIMVTYNPNIKLIERNLKELKDIDLYIIDNDSNNQFNIKKITKEYNRTNLILLPQNLGIGTAQNKGIKEVIKKNKKKYILFMDQDSFISKVTIEKLLKDIKKFPLDKVGCISAVNSPSEANNFEYVDETISSGMLIPLSNFKKVGMMYQELFIDMIDYEWCWRARKKGLLIIRDNNCVFEHQIGSNKRVLNKNIISPFRLYYVFRNSLILCKENRMITNYRITVYYKLFKQFIFNVFLCNQKKERLYFILHGIKAAKQKKMGKLED